MMFPKVKIIAYSREYGVGYSLVFPYRNFPTPRVASAGGSRIEKRSTTRAPYVQHSVSERDTLVEAASDAQIKVA